MRSGGDARLGKSEAVLILVTAAVALLLLVGVWFAFFREAEKLPGEIPVDETVAPEEFRHAVEAVAVTEENDFRRATKLWAELIQSQPTNNIFKLNQAITVLKWISDINAEIGSGQADPQELAVLNEELSEAYLEVEGIIETLSKSEIQDYRAAFVEASLLEMKALRPGADPNLRKQALDILAAQLQSRPGELLLAVKFEELASQLEFEHPELSKDRADVLYEAFEKNPRNLYVLKTAAEALMREKDPRLKALLVPSVELARPMLNAPMVARLVERLKPQELAVDVATAVEQDDWNKARRITPWLNTLVSLSGFKPDAKLAKPDVLALLETNFLMDMASRVAAGDARSSPATGELPDYRESFESSGATAVAWYDFDFDLDFDIVAASDSKLTIYECVDGQIDNEPKLELAIGMEAAGILPVDMFEVQLPGRPLAPGTVAELMEATDAPPEPLTPEQIARSRRHDTLQELLVWGVDGVRVVTLDDDDNLVVLDSKTGLEDFRQVTKIVPVDFESDGDLDLAVLDSGMIHLMQNNGNRVFQEISEYSSLPGGCVDLVGCDFDHDTDQDFLVLDPSQSQVVLLENILHSQFRTQAFDGELWQTADNATAIAVADLDNNASWDVVTLGADGARITYTRKLDGNLPAARSLMDLPVSGGALAVDDLNNDGVLDIVAGGEAGLQAIRAPTLGSDTTDSLQRKEKIMLNEKPARAISVLDFGGDGVLDILAIAEGAARVFTPEQEVSGQFMLVRVAGINDDNGGGRVNHFGVGSKLEVWADGEQFSRSVKHPVTHFGLGQRQPDNLRIVFPNGLTQNLENPPPQTLIEEKQVPRGSCPYAYGWDGEKFVMITDLLWNAPLGLQYARGKVLPDRRWEYLLLPGELMQPRNGGYELRVTEELWEVAYFDHIQLTAIDHPADVRVFTNEKVGPPDLAEHAVFATKQRIEAINATDSYGRDVLQQIRAKDGHVVQAFERQFCQGLCEPHFVELDFGRLPTDEHHLRLFLTGWMYPTDTSLNIGIDQNPERSAPEPPSLWVVDKAGKWTCAKPFMGFPGGKTKSIVIDLADVFQSDDHRIRIGASQQLYWDEAFVSWHAGDDQIRQQQLQLASADLRYHGFGKLLPRRSDQPHWFDYQELDRGASWPALEGPFTRFGDVTQILSADDDRMVVMVSGDEIALRFAPPSEELPSGWKRDFVMHSTGWDKDADLNTIEGQGSLPLPFMEQRSYPATPEQLHQQRAVWEKNADTLTRQRPSFATDSFRN